jgi:arylsulfatase
MIPELLKTAGYTSALIGKWHNSGEKTNSTTLKADRGPIGQGFDYFYGTPSHNGAKPVDTGTNVKTSVLRADSSGTTVVDADLTQSEADQMTYNYTQEAMAFMEQAHNAGEPFFLKLSHNMPHVSLAARQSFRDSATARGLDVYTAVIEELDWSMGEILDKLDELGIADNTIVMYSTDNGAEVMTWPDGGTTPFAGEKNTQWEGGYRVPTLIRWPGVIEPGTRINEIGSHEDMLPTLVAAAGSDDIKERLLEGGVRAIDRRYNVHIDGYNLLPALKGEAEWPRKEFLYWTDDGNLAALRYDQWKVHFLEQRGHGFDVWQEPFVELRLPKLVSVRSDPFERAHHEGMGYQKWRMERAFVLVPAQSFVSNWLSSFEKFPPRQKPGSFSLSQVMDKLMDSPSN